MYNAVTASAVIGSARAGTAPPRCAISAVAAIAAIGLAAISGCSASRHAAAGAVATAGPTAKAAATAAAGATVNAVPPTIPPATATAAPATIVEAPASAGPAGPAACLSRYLGAKMGVAQGTASSTYAVIDFKNLNNVSCTLYGYPGVSLAGGKPVTQIGRAAAESQATPRELVTLAPGAVANALLQIVHAANIPAPACHPVIADYLQIFPPNQTVPIYVGYTSPACSKPVKMLTVSVVQPGSGS